MFPCVPGSHGLPGGIGVFWRFDFREFWTVIRIIAFGTYVVLFLGFSRALGGYYSWGLNFLESWFGEIVFELFCLFVLRGLSRVSGAHCSDLGFRFSFVLVF